MESVRLGASLRPRDRSLTERSRAARRRPESGCRIDLDLCFSGIAENTAHNRDAVLSDRGKPNGTKDLAVPRYQSPRGASNKDSKHGASRGASGW